MNPIAQIAETYVGRPFRHQGRNPAIGLDCVGVWSAAMREAGVQFDDFRAYRKFPSGAVLLGKLREQFRQVSDPQPGDLLVIRLARSTETRHAGVYIGGDMMVHADSQAGAVVREPVKWPSVEAVFRAEVRSG